MSAIDSSAPPVYIPMDDVTRLVHADKSISLEQMQTTFKKTGNYTLPTMDAGTVPVIVGGKQVGERPITIADMNEGKFRYSYLTPEDKASPQHSGYVFVTKDSPFASADGKQIPERYWGGRDFIKIGEAFLCACLESYGKDFKEAGQNIALERLSNFTEEESSAVLKGEDGERLGGVITNSHTVMEVEEVVNNNLPTGRGKKG